jgi:peptidylprolyl isomerase
LRFPAFSCVRAVAALGLAALLTACGGSIAGPGADQVAAPPEVQITDTKVGTGINPRPGLICVVNYTGWLYENGVKGAKFDSSYDHKKPFSFTLGTHGVIEGWERGLLTMKKGGKRTLVIPPDLAYGSKGSPPMIPSNATLMFDIELLDVKAAG